MFFYGGLILSFIYFGWGYRNPAPVKCEHETHTCAQVGHKYETTKSTGWGRNNKEGIHETSYIIHQLKCKVCGVHHSQRVNVHPDRGDW